MNRCALLALVASFAFTNALAAGEAGIVVRADGPVTVERRGVSEPVAAGARINAGDVLSVADKGRAQMRMADDSVFILSQAGSLRIDELKMARKGQPGRSVYSLLRGAMRTITGLIGKGKGDIYQVRTPMATIGVRGSAYAALLCNNACASGGKFKEGLYVKGEQGLIIVTSAGGEAKVKPGQVVFVAADGSAPVKVKVSPFGDPAVAASLAISAEADVLAPRIEPPRIEPDPVPSPS